ncbi:MAG: hypothetical protein NTW65_04580 [Deltaproteobacteria bacterium]|nr:hypothetical protein [Deltaproteobacteria bacterium]
MAKTFERVNRSTTFDYSAVDNLQLMELAANYNDYLKRLILENRDQAKTAHN